MRYFNGTKLIIPLIGLLLELGLFLVGGVTVVFFLCLGCELPLPNSNRGLCQEPNFSYRFTGALLSIATEVYEIVGDVRLPTATDLVELLQQFMQSLQLYKSVILMLTLTAFVACVTRYLTAAATPIVVIAPHPITVASTIQGG